MSFARTGNPRKRVFLIAAILLLVGLGSSLAVYLTAEDDAGVTLGYEGEGGYVYPVSPRDSKTYVHDLELYGGKANVLADSFRNWLWGLWHGKTLAFTIAFCTAVLSLGFFLAGRQASPQAGQAAGARPLKGSDQAD